MCFFFPLQYTVALLLFGVNKVVYIQMATLQYGHYYITVAVI